MVKITKEQCESARIKIEELLLLGDEHTPAEEKNTVALVAVSELVIAYEEEHNPIEKPTGKEAIKMNGVTELTENQYKTALAIIEELHPLINDDTPLDNKNIVEFIAVSELVIAYEEKHFPIGKPTIDGVAKDF